MSDSFLRIIPVEPNLVPSEPSRAAGLVMLRRLLPRADAIDMRVSENVEFVDCGSNFESVSCPHCSSELTEAWEEWMDAAAESEFEDLSLTLPCCRRASDLNSLRYEWPAGFARFVLEARNPGVADVLPEDALREVEQALRVPVRQLLARY